jgi:hypothetical protein
MKTLQKFFIGASLAAFACGVASADTIITTSATAPVGPSTTDFSWSLVFPVTATPTGFHLVSATLEIDTQIMESTLTLTNGASTAQTFDFVATAENKITSNSADATLVGSISSPTTVLDTGSVTFAPGQATSYTPLSLSEVSGPAAVSNLAAYLAGVTIGGNTLSGTTFFGGGGNITAAQVQQGTITGEIVFDFAPNTTTPEPTTMVLFGSALIGLGLLRKRARS